MGKVIGYCRVSTEEQASTGLGIDAQRAAISTEAVRRGWTDLELVVDGGYSAKDLRRPGIVRALDELSAGWADVLVVAKLDRLSRSLIDFAGVIDRAQREGWELVALDLGVDTTTPAGKLMANVMASFADYERELVAQRTRHALAAKKARGARLGGPRVLDPAVRARIVDQRTAGATFAGIADLLNAEGVPTARGGACWYPSTVRAAVVSAEFDAQATAARTEVGT